MAAGDIRNWAAIHPRCRPNSRCASRPRNTIKSVSFAAMASFPNRSQSRWMMHVGASYSAWDITHGNNRRFRLPSSIQSGARTGLKIRPSHCWSRLQTIQAAHSLSDATRRSSSNSIRANVSRVARMPENEIISPACGLVTGNCGFAYSTGWRRGEIRGLQWSAVNRQTKTIFLRHSKNGEPRILPLGGNLDRVIERRWQARSIKNQNGSTTLAMYVFHCGDGQPIGDTRKSWRTACSKAVDAESAGTRPATLGGAEFRQERCQSNRRNDDLGAQDRERLQTPSNCARERHPRNPAKSRTGHRAAKEKPACPHHNCKQRPMNPNPHKSRTICTISVQRSIPLHDCEYVMLLRIQDLNW